MAHPYPLQSGDRSTNQSGRDASTAGDRRDQNIESVQSYDGHNSAPQGDTPRGPVYGIGDMAPSPFLCAPYPVVHMEGDTSGEGTQIHQIDIYAYGDSLDSTAPIRVRTVDNYELDSDFDGHKN
jgi:hypothetical protein